MLTFLYQTQLRKLGVVACESSAQGTLERKDGKYRVTEITVRPHITLKCEQDLAPAADVIKETVDLCMISNSILATVRLEPQLDTHTVVQGR